MAKKIDYASMFTLRPDGRYQGYYRSPDGVRHTVCDAVPEKLFQKILDKEAAANAPPPPPTLAEIAELWEGQHREEIGVKCWKNYRPHYESILARYGDLPIGAIVAAHIQQDIKATAAKGYSRTIVNARRSIWRMILDFAVIHGDILYNPCASIKLPKGLPSSRRSAPTDEQVKIILSSADAPGGLFALLLICTGMRKSEALALLWDDIDMDTWTISVTKALEYPHGGRAYVKPPKTEAGIRCIDVISILRQPLAAAKAKATGQIVFPAPPSSRGGDGGGFMGLRGYEGMWQRYCAATGLLTDQGKPAITAHQLRHGTATLLFEAGVDEKTAQKILGHSRVEITREIYTELREAQQRKSLGLFDEKMRQLMR